MRVRFIARVIRELTGVLFTLKMGCTSIGFLFVSLIIVLGCSSERVLKITAQDPIQVHEIATDGSNSLKKSYGTTPVELKLPEIEGKAIRFTASDRHAETWLVIPSGDYALEAKVELEPRVAKQEIALKHGYAELNQLLRKILHAYQLLASGASDEALKVANDAGKLNANVAAPHIIKGMVALKKGDAAGAKKAFEKASQLDPLDDKIAEILKSIQ